ncbi:hypothetical protein EKQ44_05170 [Sutcliffiella horikoshii]|nr:hypothetical protein [Sutcliffiella horikoshii]
MLPQEGTGKTPQGVARGGSRSPRGKRSLVRKSTAVWNRLLKLGTFQRPGRSPWRLTDRLKDKRSAWNEDQQVNANIKIIRVCKQSERLTPFWKSAFAFGKFLVMQIVAI